MIGMALMMLIAFIVIGGLLIRQFHLTKGEDGPIVRTLKGGRSRGNRRLRTDGEAS